MFKRAIRKIARIVLLTDVIRKTSWWKDRYAHTTDFRPQPLFRADYQRNYEAMVLGSDTAANDYQFGGEVLGLNLSTGYQPLEIDNRILQFYHSYLRYGGFVLFNISLFSLFKKHPTDEEYYSRFVKPFSPDDRKKYGDYYTSSIRLLDGTQMPSTLSKYLEFPMLYTPSLCFRALMGGGVNHTMPKR